MINSFFTKCANKYHSNAHKYSFKMLYLFSYAISLDGKSLMSAILKLI